MKIGTPVDYIFVEQDGREKIIPGILVGYAKNIGISIVAQDDPEMNLICLHGPDSVKYEDHAPVYKDIFEYITERITNGEPLNSGEMDTLAESNAGGGYCGDMAVCPFN